MVFPNLDIIKNVVQENNISNHNLFFYDSTEIKQILIKSNYNFYSMGRSFVGDPFFFITAGLAAIRYIELKKE